MQALRTNDCCTSKITYLFKTKKEALRYWRDELDNNGDYTLTRVLKREAKKLARDKYEREGIETQLIAL